MELKMGSVLWIWSSFLWRSLVYTAAAALMFRLTAYLCHSSVDLQLEQAMRIAWIAGCISYVPISFLAIHQALSKNSRLLTAEYAKHVKCSASRLN